MESTYLKVIKHTFIIIISYLIYLSSLHLKFIVFYFELINVSSFNFKTLNDELDEGNVKSSINSQK